MGAWRAALLVRSRTDELTGTPLGEGRGLGAWAPVILWGGSQRANAITRVFQATVDSSVSPSTLVPASPEASESG